MLSFLNRLSVRNRIWAIVTLLIGSIVLGSVVDILMLREVLWQEKEQKTRQLVESGYSFPSTADEQREFSFTLASDRMYAKSGPDRIEIRDRNNLAAGTRSLRLRLETDVYYPLFVQRVLAECRSM